MKLRTRVGMCLLATWVLLLTAGTLPAFPSRGGHCAYCHSSTGGNVAVEGYDYTAGDLKTFEIAPGGSTHLIFDVTETADGRHAVILDRLDTLNPGIYEPRRYTPDPDWSTASGRDPDHRYLFWYGQYYSTILTEELGSYTFDLVVAPDVAPGDYLLEATLAGGFPSDGLGWHKTENFVLRVIPEPNSLALIFVMAITGGLSLVYKSRRRAPG